MVKYILIAVPYFFSLLLHGQDSTFLYKSRIVDAYTKKNLIKASIKLDDLRGTTTDSNGHFELLITKKNKKLTITYLGYEPLVINPHTQAHETWQDILLKQKNHDIKEIVVHANAIEPVAKSKKSYVLDYDFYDNNILIISYGSSKASAKISLISDNMDTLSMLRIPEEPVKLFRDCLDNHYVVCYKKFYQVYYDLEGLHFLYPHDLGDLENILLPCVAQDSSNLYFIRKSGSYLLTGGLFHDFKTSNHQLTYAFINKSSKERNDLVDISDAQTAALKADEKRYRKTKEQNGLYGKYDQDFEIIFAETILYKEIYAPLYKIDHKIYVFDFMNSRIQSYSPSGTLLTEVKMTFHKNLKWKRFMCVDEKENKPYTLFEKNGISELKEIDLQTGKDDFSKKIPIAFVENIKVRNNYVYFIHKGTDYDDTRYLSRIRMR